MSDLGRTSTGLSPRVAASASYLAWWLTGLLFLVVERDNAFVRFHARQALFFLGGAWLVGTILVAASFLTAFLSPAVYRATAGLALAAWGVALAGWIAGMVQAARGRWWSVPLLGDRLHGVRPDRTVRRLRTRN
jgi:uncharacterized membrane protein